MVQYVILKLPDHHALSFIYFNIIIFSDQLDIKYVRGTGPGGQHVNTSLY
jgi:protein subunit release factor B